MGLHRAPHKAPAQTQVHGVEGGGGGVGRGTDLRPAGGGVEEVGDGGRDAAPPQWVAKKCGDGRMCEC